MRTMYIRLINYLNSTFPIYINQRVHNYGTRISNNFHINKINYSKNCIRFSLPKLLNDTNVAIRKKVNTLSIHGFIGYVKHVIVLKYSNECDLINCYICSRNE